MKNQLIDNILLTGNTNRYGLKADRNLCYIHFELGNANKKILASVT